MVEIENKPNRFPVKVSVIIPMYNAKLYIEEAIQSVLAQNYPVAEIIVVDDGSTDGSAEIVSRYKDVILLKKAHSGIFSTMNAGLAMAQSDFIAFLDADDRWLPSKTDTQVRILLDNATFDMTFGYAERFQMIEDGENVGERKIDILPGVAVQGGLFRKSAFERIGDFSTDPERHGFMEWYASAKAANLKIWIHSEVVFERRIHAENTGILSKDTQRRQYFNTLRSVIDRKKG